MLIFVCLSLYIRYTFSIINIIIFNHIIEGSSSSSLLYIHQISSITTKNFTEVDIDITSSWAIS